MYKRVQMIALFWGLIKKQQREVLEISAVFYNNSGR
jgi:hypothetical protein